MNGSPKSDQRVDDQRIEYQGNAEADQAIHDETFDSFAIIGMGRKVAGNQIKKPE